jgi:hypothetical protein
MSSPFRYVPGCSVEYRGPTDTLGGRWVAVIRRGRDRSDCYRATVAFEDGPDAAARAAVDRFNAAMDSDWVLLGAALSMDGGDCYAYPVGPAELAPVLSSPAPARPES